MTLHWVQLDPAADPVTSPAPGASAGDTVFLLDPATDAPSDEPLRGTIELSQELTDEEIASGRILWAGARLNAEGDIVEYPGFETVFADPDDDTSGILELVEVDGNFRWARTAGNVGLFITVGEATSPAVDEGVVSAEGGTLAYPTAGDDCLVDAVVEVDKTNDADRDDSFSDAEVAPDEGAATTFQVVVTNPGPWAGQVRLFDALDDGSTLFLFGQDPADAPDVATSCVRAGGEAFLVDDVLAGGRGVDHVHVRPRRVRARAAGRARQHRHGRARLLRGRRQRRGARDRERRLDGGDA